MANWKNRTMWTGDKPDIMRGMLTDSFKRWMSETVFGLAYEQAGEA